MMNKNCLFLIIIMILASQISCSHDANLKDIIKLNYLLSDNSNDMYVPYKLDDSSLQETGLPVISIQTAENAKILSKKNWVSAEMQIYNAKNSEWDFDGLDISIRGRGNTTWELSKRPYAIKLSSQKNILGMPEHNRWVLIANYWDNSFIKNAIAFYISRQIGMDYTIRGEYVNFVLNGNYVGLYWLGEAIKIDTNRVDIDDENDYLIEMDSHYDESWRFHSALKNLPYMIKNDEKMNAAKFTNLKDRISEMENILYSSSFPYTNANKNEFNIRYSEYIDLDSFAKFYIVNEIMHNGELQHPNSCFFTFTTDSGLLKAGPVWDFDWACYTTKTELILKNTLYFDSLFKLPEFNEKLSLFLSDSYITEEGVFEEVENLREEISKAVVLDGERWGTNHRNQVGNVQTDFDAYVDDVKNCIISRLKFMKEEMF
ncbi:MAG: CotH kinase family protein [Treponema sp.]|nr:CotH kinase family protein [Treponema sp.]